MNENSPNPNLNETDLLELALRLATFPGDPRTQNAQLLRGQIPDQLPVDIPFPEGSRVLGSLIRNPESISMFLRYASLPRTSAHLLQTTHAGFRLANNRYFPTTSRGLHVLRVSKSRWK